MGQARAKRQQLQKARDWMLKHPNASIADTMRAMGISQSSVSAMRRELKAAGFLGTYPHTPGLGAVETAESAPAGPSVIQTPPPISEAEAEAVLSGSGQTTREERRQRLDALVRYGAPDHVIRASKAIEDMEKTDKAPDEVGAPPPQTLKDGIDQVADMIEALAAWGGESAVKEAVTTGLARAMQQEIQFHGKTTDVSTTAVVPSAELDLSRPESEVGG